MTDTLSLAEKVEGIASQLSDWKKVGLKVFASSSFLTQSLPLLHILSTHASFVDVVFLDTGYHFPETLTFRDRLVDRLDLNLINAKSHRPKSDQRTANGRLLFTQDPDQCCYINKIAPLEPFLRDYDVWISGVRSDQTANRKTLKKISPGPQHVVRFHPMLDWTAKEIYEYRILHDLPSHPLEEQGYLSVGCMPCSRPFISSVHGFDNEHERGGRWAGQTKTECGLHTELSKQGLGRT